MIRTVLSPAKINLFLYVTGLRPDGYHELYSLMAPIDLCDTLTLTFGGKGIRAVCSHPDVPADGANLACRAAALYQEALAERHGQRSFDGVHIHIDKQVPVGGGLGGGSSNAAAVLMALNDHYGRPFSREELMGLGLALGADVPFFMMGGPAFARGVGEILSPCRNLPKLYLVLANPGVFSSTVEVFKKLEFGLTFTPDYTMNTGSNVLPKGLLAGDWDGLHNDLEAPACRLYPEIGAAKEEMRALLQQQVFMSGSGASLFALYSDRDRAEKGHETLSRAWSGSGKQVFFTRVEQGNG